MSIQEKIESNEHTKSMMSSSSLEYVCVNAFLADEKTYEIINTLGIDSYSVRKIVKNYAGHLQVPTEWKYHKLPEEKKLSREIPEPTGECSPESAQATQR